MRMSIISETLFYYIHKVKKQIEPCSEHWDNTKKYTNPYEYIHTVIPNCKTAICKLKPLSRSFYKMIEITSLLDILDKNLPSLKTFHLAEGPGGFIEAMTYIRDNPHDTYYGMTLISDDINVPGWNKSQYFLDKNPNVIIEKGKDNTGDLLSTENLKYCLKKYRGTMDLITGDGGFDFSVDFNKQELLASKLLLAQVSFAIAMQKHNGNFVLKIFDVFTKATVDILYMLSCLYDQVYIIKPNTSRYANSEKYVVCKGFKLYNSSNLVEKLIDEYPKLNSSLNIGSILNIKYDNYFLNILEEFNAILGQQQIENISSTINLIQNSNRTDKLEMRKPKKKKNNIQRCVNWCTKYKVPYNKNIQQVNIFLSQ